MSRPRTQDLCRCGLPAYALNLCEACYRYERRTGLRRKAVSLEVTEERLFARREHRIIRDLERKVMRTLLLSHP